jgi:hypothetical protein
MMGWLQKVALRMSLVAVLSLFASPARAGSLSAAESRYMRGDFRGAEASASQALRSETRSEERAKLLKLLGIVQYMQNKKTAASQSFRAAIALSPAMTISPDEVLDEGVIQHFNAQKQTAPRTGSQPANARTSRPPPPRSVPAKTTRVVINSNVSSARVSMDGILAGSVGSPIEADPGRVVFEVAAAGHITKKIAINLPAGRETTVTVNLDKIPPPRPKAPPRRETVARAPQPAEKQQTGRSIKNSIGAGID